MTKVPVSTIERVGIPIRDRYKNFIHETDINGRTRRRYYDGYIGIGRRVIAATMQGAVVFDEARFSRRFHSDSIEGIILDTKHHSGLNRWMERATARINKQFGNNTATVQGDFYSGSLPEVINKPTADLGYRSAEDFFLLKHIADSLVFGSNKFEIKVDTDAEPERADVVKAFAVSSNDDMERWNEFIDYFNSAWSAYSSEREHGTDIARALRVANAALHTMR